MEQINLTKKEIKRKPFSDETKRRMSLAHIGKILSKETRMKISKSNKGKIRTEESKLKYSLSKRGIIFTEEHKRNISLANKGKIRTEEVKMKYSLAKMGNKINLGKKHSEETKKKMSLIRLNKTEEEKSKFMKSMLKDKKIFPNEKKLLNIIEKNYLPFNYVGNGKVIINGFCPDFLSKNPKHIIELFGSGHYSKIGKERDKRRLNIYSSLGYKTLIINNWELKNESEVVKKIKNFINQ